MKTSVPLALAAALDDWALVCKETRKHGDTTWKKLLATARAADPDEWGSVGVVVGATIDADTGLDFDALGGSILAPGFGAQGGTVEDLRMIFGPAYARVIPSSSRGILYAGPEIAGIRTAVEAAQRSLD